MPKKPAAGSVALNFYVPGEMHEWIREYAHKHNISIAEVARNAIAYYRKSDPVRLNLVPTIIDGEPVLTPKKEKGQ